MKKPLAIDPDVLKRLAALPKTQRAECLHALCDLCEAFGKPHVHGGLGIRKLTRNLFECRGNLDLRFLFQDRAGCLYISFLGDHDEVRALLRSKKY